jgi:hypothetical protein
MHLLLSLIFGGILLFLLARALFETVIGLCQILISLLLLAIAYLLDATAWAIRTSKSLWRTAFG